MKTVSNCQELWRWKEEHRQKADSYGLSFQPWTSLRVVEGSSHPGRWKSKGICKGSNLPSSGVERELSDVKHGGSTIWGFGGPVWDAQGKRLVNVKKSKRWGQGEGQSNIGTKARAWSLTKKMSLYHDPEITHCRHGGIWNFPGLGGGGSRLGQDVLVASWAQAQNCPENYSHFQETHDFLLQVGVSYSLEVWTCQRMLLGNSALFHPVS